MNLYDRDRLSRAVRSLSVSNPKCIISSTVPGQTIACCQLIVLQTVPAVLVCLNILHYFRILPLEEGSCPKFLPNEDDLSTPLPSLYIIWYHSGISFDKLRDFRTETTIKTTFG